MEYIVCDVFAERPLAGNPLAIFPDGEHVPEQLMQPLARELNLSETVFLMPSAAAHARLRIFTPLCELPFAGHPTLGAAAVIAEIANRDRVALETGAGVIDAVVEPARGNASFVWMAQPLPQARAFASEDKLLAALGLTTSLLPIEIYDNGIPHVYVAAENAAAVAGLEPDLAALVDASPTAGVTCFARDGSEWKVRMFAPAHGVPEDPATGSAAGPLAVHLIRHHCAEIGEEICLRQGIELGRSSLLMVRTHGTHEVTSICVGGGVFRVGRGHFELAAGWSLT